MVRNTAFILALVVLSSAFMFGCTGSTGTSNPEIKSASAADNAMSAAYADKANKYAFKFVYGEDGAPFSGTMSFISGDGSSRKQFHLTGGLLIDRSEICSGSGAKTERYKYLRVTFDDSPVNETWDWTDYGYCEGYYFYPGINGTQMEAVRHPADPMYRKTAALASLYPDKIALAFTVGSWGNATYDGTATFIAPEGQARSFQTASGMLLLDRGDMCDPSGKDRYPDMNVTFKDSPIGETWHWDTDYCRPGPHVAWITEEQLSGLKDPRFDISLFEYDSKGGDPINATVYCNDVMLGPLVNGHLNTSKAAVLRAMGSGGCNISFIGNFTVFERPYRFNFCGWTLDREGVISYGAFTPYLDDSFGMYLRRAPCDTPMSFVTPNDTMVQYRLQRYMRAKTADTYLDLDLVRHYMEKDFGYEKDDVQFQVGDWWQLPTEFMSVKAANKGDCEDWAISFLSLVYAREPTRCWGMRVDFVRSDDTSVEGHVSVFCDVNGVHKIYDQTGVVTEPDIWGEYFRWFDYGNEFTDRGAVRIKPTYVFNNTFYSEVDDVAGMYRVLGIEEHSG
ncbi:Uncharacterised protein [uncultured archaeon]|nr:Uncharacterised protein [uncultured archaeon]